MLSIDRRVSPSAPQGVSGLSELADKGLCTGIRCCVSARERDAVPELGLPGAAQGGNCLHWVICQDWEKWSQGDPEAGDEEQEDSGLDIRMEGMCLGLACCFQKN